MKQYTLCRLCSACCPVEVEIRNNKITSVQRIKRYSDALHQVCPKAEAAPEILYSEKRLKSPMLKDRKNKWIEVNWEKAIDMVAQKMTDIKDKYGPEAVCWLRGQAPDWGGAWHYAMRLMHAFGSPNVIGNGSVCHAGREAMQVFTYGEMTNPDYKNSRCILCWGRNDKDTNPSLYEDLLYARSQGAKLIVIDPVKTEIAEQADLWLPIQPGTDGFLAMAMMYWMIKHQNYNHEFVNHWTIGFEKLTKEVLHYSPKKVEGIVKLSADEIIEAVQCYVHNQPACIAEGNGLDMHCYVSQVTRAIAILRAISGNLDQKGGDLLPQPIPIKNFQLRNSIWQHPEPISKNYPLFSQYSERRGIHTLGVLTDAILEGKPYPIKGLIVQGANPIVTMANSNRVEKALQKLDFLVVIDPMMTQTAFLADIILPASYSFEQTMISNQALSNNFIRLHKKVIEPYAQSRPDWEIIFTIAQKLGFKKEFPWQSVEEAITYQLQPSGIETHILWDKPEGIITEQTRYKKYLTEGFKTPTGKVEIESTLLNKYGYEALPKFWDNLRFQEPSFYRQKEEFPFIVLSGKRPNYFVHSQFRHISSLTEKGNFPVIDINPQDAEKNNIRQGDLVRVSSPNGSIEMKINISCLVLPGMLRIAWGWGEVEKCYNLNLLTDDLLKDSIISTTSNRILMGKLTKI